MDADAVIPPAPYVNLPAHAPAPAPAPNVEPPVQSLQLPPPGHRLALPEGWLDCPPIGSLFGQHLLPCKVPLGQRFDEVLRGPLEQRRFTPAHALQAAHALPGFRVPPRVLAMIDLTKTSRYYAPEEEGLVREVRHIKLPCAGKQGAPTPVEASMFCYVVEALLEEARRAQPPPPAPPTFWPIIIVHCTHGFNRTGAMLVHHAMRTRGAPPDLLGALEGFARCRQPGIYKEDYIACACLSRARTRAICLATAMLTCRVRARPASALFDYYHDVRPEPPRAVCPPTPAWKGGPEGPPPLRDEDIPPGDLWGAPRCCAACFSPG